MKFEAKCPLAEAPKAYERIPKDKTRFRAVLTMESPLRVVAARFRVDHAQLSVIG